MLSHKRRKQRRKQKQRGFSTEKKYAFCRENVCFLPVQCLFPVGRLSVFMQKNACYGTKKWMFMLLMWHFSGINTYFSPTIPLFTALSAAFVAPFSSISNVNISLSSCILDRKQVSFPFFSPVLYFGPKEAILRRSGNQNVILKKNISLHHFTIFNVSLNVSFIKMTK